MEGEYKLVETLHTEEREAGKNKLSLSLEKQSRELEQGRMTRPYPILHFKMNERNTYFHIDVACALLDMLALCCPLGIEERKKFDAEMAEFRKQREQSRQGGRNNGKTEREKAKPNYKPSEQKKKEKSEKDRQLRQKMQGRKGG